MTATERRDPVAEAARLIQERWKADEDARQYARALSIARRQASREARAVHDSEPANWIHRFRKAGVVGIATTWPGCPIDPSSCIPAGGAWEIDPEGVWIRLEGHERQFVCGPVAPLGNSGEVAALIKGRWVTIPLPSNDRHLTARKHAESMISALGAAGVRFGTEIVHGVRDDNLDRRSGAEWAAIWATGYSPISDSIGHSPIRLLSRIRPEDDRGDAEGRQQLGEVLQRMPSDVRGPRR